MKEIFKDVLGIEGVHGVILLSREGEIMLSQCPDNYKNEEGRAGKADWKRLAHSLRDAVEAEFIFDRRRIYVRRSQSVFLLVILDDIAPISMVRLNCEILQPALDRIKTGGRLSKLLKKRIF